MLLIIGMLDVIHSRPAQAAVIKWETAWANDLTPRPKTGGESQNAAEIGGLIGLEQANSKHGMTMVSGVLIALDYREIAPSYKAAGMAVPPRRAKNHRVKCRSTLGKPATLLYRPMSIVC